ncbi:MAG: GNAT family N-acetyltransferase [Patescibacteria group bacterium]
MSLTTRIISSREELQELEPAWCDLLEKTESSTFFSTPTFQLSWLNTMGADRTPQYVVCFDDQELVAVMPLIEVANQPGVLESVGSVDVTDYYEPSIQAERSAEVLEALLAQLAKTSTTLRLYGLPGNSPVLWLHSSSKFSVTKTEQAVSPQIALPHEWQEYLQQLDRKQRHEVKRKLRKVEAIPHQFEVLTEQQTVADALPDFFQLHQASSPEKAAFWNQQTRAFFTQLVTQAAIKQQLKLFFLQIDNSRVATMLVFEYASTYYLYNSGFNPTAYRSLSTGTVLTAYTIRHAIENNIVTYDFLRGKETYKFRLGGKPTSIYDLELHFNQE